MGNGLVQKKDGETPMQNIRHLSDGIDISNKAQRIVKANQLVLPMIANIDDGNQSSTIIQLDVEAE